MKLPLSWLAEFVTVEAPLEQLCARLTVAGLEVESVDHIAPTFTDVFVAKVLAVERHPNADRLNLCDVDAGAAGRFRVVCGAPNAHAGMTAALARVGSRLAAGAHGAGSGSLENAIPLQAAVIRGVPSEGMLCSEMELGMSKDHEGILELPYEAPAGEPLASYLRLPDVVLDIAITPNRGDCLSILGLAREVAALFELKLKVPRYRNAKVITAGASEGAVTVDLRAPELCPRYAVLALDGVTIGPSPIRIRRRLELCGMRALNNVVDVTNYVMLELGQPLHAFNAARVANRAITVRRAADDRKFITLDGDSRTLEPDDLLIADGEKPLAIAGVMGGQTSEVDAATTAIILESAYFEPSAIARTARRLGLRSEASYRFERGIDRDGQMRAMRRAAELIREIAGGRELNPPLDVQPHPAPPREINFGLQALTALLGVALPLAVVKHRLRAVGAIVAPAGRDRLKVTAPTFRPDLNETADLAEEVARLSGLAEIPAILPPRTAAVAMPDASRTLRRKIRDALIGCGLVEAKTIAFIAPSDNERFPGLQTADAVQVTNPLSAELSEMRTSLIPGLLAALRFNLNREATAFHFFELGKVFGARNGVAEEFERIAAVSYGDFAMGTIGQPAVGAGFAILKGLLETILATLSGVGGFEFARIPQGLAPYLHPGRSAMITLAGKLCGVLGELHPGESLKLDLQLSCALFELDLPQLLAYGSTPRKKVTAPSRYPAVRRDVALVVDRDFPAGTVTAAIAALDPALLESAELFDVYEGATLPAGKKSVAVACKYRGKDGTLTDDEVNRAHAALVNRLAAQLGAELRQ